jgi:importin subunit alpha-1
LNIIMRAHSKLSYRNAVHTLATLLHGKPIPDFNVISSALPVLNYLLFDDDEDILIDACWAISYISNGPSNYVQAIVDQSKITHRITDLLMHNCPLVQSISLRIIGNISAENDQIIQNLIEHGLLTRLAILLNHSKKRIQKEACWTISNITTECINAIIDANIIPQLIKIVDQCSDFEIQREAVWAICSVSNTDEQIKYIVDCGALETLCKLLLVNDTKLVNVILRALVDILASGKRNAEKYDTENIYADAIVKAQGLDKLEMLQQRNDGDTADRALAIILEYFAHDIEQIEYYEVAVNETQI